MNLLLDEQMPGKLGRLLSGHEFFTVQQMGWDGKHNGELLALARNRFDAFITLDRNMEYQQNITEADIPILVLITRNSRIEYLEPLVPKILDALTNPERGQVTHIRA